MAGRGAQRHARRWRVMYGETWDTAVSAGGADENWTTNVREVRKYSSCCTRHNREWALTPLHSSWSCGVTTVRAHERARRPTGVRFQGSGEAEEERAAAVRNARLVVEDPARRRVRESERRGEVGIARGCLRHLDSARVEHDAKRCAQRLRRKVPPEGRAHEAAAAVVAADLSPDHAVLRPALGRLCLVVEADDEKGGRGKGGGGGERAAAKSAPRRAQGQTRVAAAGRRTL